MNVLNLYLEEISFGLHFPFVANFIAFIILFQIAASGIHLPVNCLLLPQLPGVIKKMVMLVIQKVSLILPLLVG